MARAIAHGTTPVAKFADPTALALLPEEARERVARVKAGHGKGVRAAVERALLLRHAQAMVARTVEIDEAVRAAAHGQVVILGAGLDGRAWRMPELADTVVFEVDHPASQRVKRSRLATLNQAAREVRFVAVDFERDDLDQALASAGHDATRPTTWVWEGVVMYLSPADVESTLAILARRSAPGSRVVVVYHRPARILRVLGFALRWIGEPLRSSYTAEAMRALLRRHGFTVLADRDVGTIATSLSEQLERETRVMRHLRIATAERAAGA